MPLYEYECIKCDRIEEALQKFSDRPLTKCRHCSGRLHKMISQSSFHLKGSGWYVTDYANKSRSNSASTPTETEKKAKKESKTTPTAENTS